MTASTSPARDLLRSFLAEHGISRKDIAEAIGVSPAACTYWLSDDPGQQQTPRSVYRLRIERYTGGAVPAAAWLTPEERAALDAVAPFEPASAPQPFEPKQQVA